MRSIRDSEDDGFTLLEVAVVTLILGILVAISVASYTVAADRSRRISCQTQLRVLTGAVASYQDDNDGVFPADLSELDPYVQTSRYDLCPDGSSTYTYDALTGRIDCPTHPTP